MISQIFDLDQAHLRDYDIAGDWLYLSGIGDAVEGSYPTNCEWEYLKGYGEGCRIVQARLQCELALLKGEANGVEAILEEF